MEVGGIASTRWIMFRFDKMPLAALQTYLQSFQRLIIEIPDTSRTVFLSE